MSEAALYLASASPRRRALLDQIGVACEVVAAEIDESHRPGEAAQDYVQRLALGKAQAVWRRTAGARPVLAADTTVVLEGALLGKPVDRADALGMLGRLSGRTHEVLTAVALVTARGARAALSRSEVSFRAIGAAEAERYWASGEPRDKAGAYAIQGRGAVFVSHLSGSFSGVMGLPLFETAELLREAGIDCWGTIEP
jgi:septum formation protein